MAKSTTISGLTITIGADTKQFSSAIKQLEAEARNIAKDLKTVGDNFKIDPSNANKAAESMKLLQEQAKIAGDKVKLYKEAIEKLNKEYKNNVVSQGEYNESLKHLQILLGQAQNEQDLANAKIKEFSKETNTASKNTTSLGDAIKKFVTSEAIKQGLADLVDMAKKLGETLWNAAKKVASGVVSFAKEGMDIAEENKQTLAKVGQVFGDSKQEIVDWSKDAVTAMGLTAGEAQSAAATFGNMFTALEVSDKEAAKMSMDLVQLAADVGAFNNVTTASVLENFQSGLAGTSRQLRQYGIVINAAQIETKALEMTLKESADDLTEGDKIVARYAIMMEQAAKQSGQFAREFDSVTVQTQILQARIKELKGSIGEQLTPVYARLLAMANELLNNPAVQTMIKGAINNVEKLAKAFQALFDDIHFDDLSGSFSNIIRQLTDKLRLVLPSIVQFGAEVISGIIEGMNSYLPLLVVDLLPLARQIIMTLLGNTEAIVEGAYVLIKEFAQAISLTYHLFQPVMVDMLKNISQFIVDRAPELTEAAITIITTLADALIVALPILIPAVAELIVRITNTIVDHLPELIEKGWDIVKAIAKGLLEASGLFINGVQDLLEKGAAYIAEHIDDIVAWGKKIPEYMMDGIKSMKEWFQTEFWDWLKGIWDDVVESLKSSNPFNQDSVERARQGHQQYLQNNYGISEASGGPVFAGQLYRVNDDAGRRSEWFIPNQNGYILNGNQTDRIVNNNNSRTMGNVNIYVNSYGMNVAEVADELGQAFSQRLRMSGAML